MIIRIALIISLCYSFSFSSFQKVRIGKIDKQYSKILSKNKLKKILKEIENTFESQLNTNVFDYSSRGKPIDILYVAPSKLEKGIKNKISKLENTKEEISRYKKILPSKKKEIEQLKKLFDKKNKVHNKKIAKYNKYVKSLEERELTATERERVRAYMKREKRKFDNTIRKLEKERKPLKKAISSYNQNLKAYNSLVNKYNKLSKQIEAMSRGFSTVKGRAYGSIKLVQKVSYKNGKRVKENYIKNSMDRIEVYGFDNLKQLKAVLAHEIGHLVGLPHINVKNALMNPILQKKQERKLFLTYHDIVNFEENF